MNQIEEIKKKQEELKKRIEEKLNKVQKKEDKKEDVNSYTTLINQKQVNKKELKLEKGEIDMNQPFYDPNLPLPKNKRKRELKLNEQGKYIEIAEKIRNIEKIQGKEEEEKEDNMIELELGREDIPKIEWWDLEVKVTHLIQHPIPVIKKKEELPVMPILLTEKERKKLKTNTKIQREKEKQRKIKLGILPTPPPKANLNNFMKIHLNDGTQDPTLLENKIKEEIEKRKQNHENRNQERKLTKEEKIEKKKKKVEQDLSLGVECCFYHLNTDLLSDNLKHKINLKSKDHFITGRVLFCEKETFIIAEGGHKYLSKFIDSFNKIKWENENITCNFIWRGDQKKKNFRGFQFISFDHYIDLKNYFQQHGLPNQIIDFK